MRHFHHRCAVALCASGLLGAALVMAQTPDREAPRPQDVDPAVDTSGPASEPAREAPRPQDVDPAVNTSRPAAAQGSAASRGTGARSRAQDRIELDTTQITGNRELPKVLYIVPWKRSDLGDLVGKPVNSLLDEVLTPVDRDVFKRENRYYRALASEGGAPAGSSAAPAAGSSPAPGASVAPAARDER